MRSRMRNSMGVSQSRRLNHTKTKRHTEAMLEKSVTCNSKITIDKFNHNSINKDLSEDIVDNCETVVQEFREGVTCLIQQQPISKKKIMRLCGWLEDSLREMFRNRRDPLKLSVLDI